MKPAIERRNALALTAGALLSAVITSPARADSGVDPAVFAPVKLLDDALIAAMKAGDAAPFRQRYRALQPVIDRVFDLHAVLTASIGLSWMSFPPTQKATLTAAFTRYTVSSYVANFDSYNSQYFEIVPDVRTIGNGEVVVGTRLVRREKAPAKLDYVLRNGPNGWQIVDVLTDGSISRVAVQRSDFRQLLANGGPAALTAGLQRKVANLSDSMQG